MLEDQHSSRQDQPSELPTYQGRRLPKPTEELVDQGLGFDVGTLLSRRQALRALGLGAATMGLAACGAGTSTTTTSTNNTSEGAASSAGGATASSGEIPDETAGPYPGDGSNGPDVLEQSGVVRSDLRTSFGESSGTAHGVPMTLDLTLTDLANDGVPFTEVAVYVWHCDREGRYSMYSDGVTDQNYLRGVQVADANGKVSFTSIFPACYSGRWPHVHFEVYPSQGSITDASSAIATSQVALPKSACDEVYATAGYENSVTNLAQVSLDSDGVFGDDGGESQLATMQGSVSDGYAASLAVAVDTGTTPSGGGMGGPEGGSGGMPDGPPPDGGQPGDSGS